MKVTLDGSFFPSVAVAVPADAAAAPRQSPMKQQTQWVFGLYWR
jgi:hypothetical protein